MLKKIFLNKSEQIAQRTQFTFLWMRLLGTPCWCLLSMLAFILYKNIHLTPLQITVIVALKPTSSLLSPYWTLAIYQRPDRIISNLMGANFFRYLPFLFVPWIDSAWFMIFAFGIYMTLTRATIPAWMELFKYNLPKQKREQIVGYGTTIDYLGSALFSVMLGIFLDHAQVYWKWLFVLTAGLGMFSSLLLHSLSMPHIGPIKEVPKQIFKIKGQFFTPWKRVGQLIRQHKDFTIFQIGFMLGGAGLMIMQPALPKFFIDKLNLSFVEMGLAISLCKGIGVAITSPLWTRLFRRVNIFQLSALVTFFATLFPFLLLSTSLYFMLLYLAYAFYGIMQAGSELTWHMSGLVFAGEKDSSTFSSTNVLTVGIRGCFIPALGSMLLPIIHPIGVILLGAMLCLTASCYFLYNNKQLKNGLLKSHLFSKSV